jgi:hypothetical protein
MKQKASIQFSLTHAFSSRSCHTPNASHAKGTLCIVPEGHILAQRHHSPRPAHETMRACKKNEEKMTNEIKERRKRQIRLKKEDIWHWPIASIRT